MGQNSNIEWTHHTFNPWRGCTKVSDGCKFCYAETLSGRNPGTLGVWGPQGTRVIASESMWHEPRKWDKAAQQAGERHRVFGASLSDVFEGPETMPDVSVSDVLKARVRLLNLIAQTSNLDYLLLTKRPQNILGQLQDCLNRPESTVEGDRMLARWLQGEPPTNVWLGTSVEDQKAADARIPELLVLPAKVRFLSCEPLLGPVDLSPYLCDFELGRCNNKRGNLHWVICGGESGPKARPLHPAWARSLSFQCVSNRVPFFFKQWGEWLPYSQGGGSLSSTKIRNISQDNEDDEGMGVLTYLVGKKAAGRLLDGREWNEFPEVSL